MIEAGLYTVIDLMSKDIPTFDPDFLRNKYREERDKRLNTAGIKQYLEIKENLSFLKLSLIHI